MVARRRLYKSILPLRWVTLGLLGVLLVSQVLPAWRQFRENLGWWQLVKLSSLAEERTVMIPSIQRNLLAASSPGLPGSFRPFLGAGLASAQAGDDQAALTFWKQGDVPASTLTVMGLNYVAQARYDQALTMFWGADAQQAGDLDEGSMLFGQTCQFLRHTTTAVSRRRQQNCADYFSRASGNLIVNGAFSAATLWAWRTEVQPTGAEEAKVDTGQGRQAPSATFRLTVAEGRVGLAQRIALQPGEQVRFSAWIRFDGPASTKVRPLYIGWRTQDKAQGNAPTAQVRRQQWVFAERMFTAPMDEVRLYTFFPLLVDGPGQAWLDDVQVQSVSQNHETIYRH